MNKSKKLKRKKYRSRTEKNKRIYNQSSSLQNTNSKKLFILILIISIIFNINLLSRNSSLESSLENLKDEYENEIDTLKTEYTNYLFLGDSITDFYDLDKYYEGLPVVNSGISGNTTEDILSNMDSRVYNYNPSKVFLLIGTNDLLRDKSVEEITENIEIIVNNIRKNEPQTEVYIESIYPVNYELDKSMVGDRSNEDIKQINENLKKYCQKNDYTYIDTYNLLIDEDGNFSEEYTDDGLHPNDKGYEVITEELKKYLD